MSKAIEVIAGVIIFMILQVPLYMVTRVFAVAPLWIQGDLVRLFEITPLSEGTIVLATHVVMNIALMVGVIAQHEEAKKANQAGGDDE